MEIKKKNQVKPNPVQKNDSHANEKILRSYPKKKKAFLFQIQTIYSQLF